MQQTVVIKKYPNRRLYDTSAGRYVNLDDVAALIRKGADVRVVDAKTAEDVTRVILTQIIVEDAKDRPTLPLELLRQLILASDRAGQEFITWYLKSAFDAYHKVQDAVQTRLTDLGTAALSLFTPPPGGMPGDPPHSSAKKPRKRKPKNQGTDTGVHAAQKARRGTRVSVPRKKKA